MTNDPSNEMGAGGRERRISRENEQKKIMNNLCMNDVINRRAFDGASNQNHFFAFKSLFTHFSFPRTFIYNFSDNSL